MKPLDGVRVLDLTNVLAGPFCCHQLAHLGAEVIKVEAAGRGDLARNLGADPALNDAGMGVSFLAQNAGKKSVTLNLKHAAGKDLLKRLVRTADVLVENFRPGVMAITGDADSAPLRVGYPIADTVGGLTAAMAISAALNASPRGAFLDVSMLESVLATMGWVISNHLIAGAEPQPHGNENPTSAPSGAFEAGGGLVNIAANKDEQWVALTDHLGLAALRDRPDYATREDRKRNRLALKAELEAVLATRPARDWAKDLNRIGVPAGAVLTVPEVLAMPQVADRGFVQRFENAPGVGRDIDVVTVGVKLDGAAPTVSDPPPRLGEHNDTIWRELGLSESEIAALRAEGTL
jgi:formyl-CoA transferase